MKTVNELTRFDFHDSLIESIEYYEESNKVTIEIDFCNWKQEGYRDEDEETTMMYLSFEDVTECWEAFRLSIFAKARHIK